MQTKQKAQFSTIDEYLALQPSALRATLEQLRQIIKKAAPGAEETISYQMPAFKFHGMLVWFAGYKNHYGLYPMPKTIQVFKDKLTAYELSKGTIRFPLDKPVPVKLITEIVKYRVKENLEKELLKDMVKIKRTKK
jgi:uncharacterized protein YdhG (YjbR/CyaY superfamily)